MFYTCYIFETCVVFYKNKNDCNFKIQSGCNDFLKFEEVIDFYKSHIKSPAFKKVFYYEDELSDQEKEIIINIWNSYKDLI